MEVIFFQDSTRCCLSFIDSFDLFLLHRLLKAINSLSKVLPDRKHHPFFVICSYFARLFPKLTILINSMSYYVYFRRFFAKIAYHDHKKRKMEFTSPVQSGLTGQSGISKGKLQLVPKQIKSNQRWKSAEGLLFLVQKPRNEIIGLQLGFLLESIIGDMSDFEEQEGYSPERDRQQSEHDCGQVYKRRVEKFNKNSIEGKWTEEENLRYILYMDAHYKIFASKEKRKSQRIFKSLSEFLVTRTPRQCRSHFQKIMNKFASLRKVRQFYQEELGAANYQARLDEINDELRRNDIKTQQTQAPKLHAFAHVEVQTDPMALSLDDLKSQEVLRLMNLLIQYQKAQLPFPLWHPAQNQITVVKERKAD